MKGEWRSRTRRKSKASKKHRVRNVTWKNESKYKTSSNISVTIKCQYNNRAN